MKRIFLLLIIFSFTSCAGQHDIFKEAKVKASVEWINGETSQISTAINKVNYHIDSEYLEIEKEYWFHLVKIEQSPGFRTRRATVSGIPVKTCKTVLEEAEEYIQDAVEFPPVLSDVPYEEYKLKATVIEARGDSVVLGGDHYVVIYEITGLDAGKEYWFRFDRVKYIDGKYVATVVGIPVKTCKTILAEAREYLRTSRI